MALTIVSTPNNIDNSAAFNVTTSLVEDSNHVNLRVRADVYHEGIIKAVGEKPKGLANFDFGDILKSLTPGYLRAKDVADICETGTVGSNLLTDFTHDAGWDTFIHTGFSITSAIEASTSWMSATSNNIAMQVGEIYLLYTPDFVSSGVNTPLIKLYGTTTQYDYEYIFDNKGIIIMPTIAGNFYFLICHNGLMNFSGTFYLHKITTSRTTTGNPLAPYFVIFSEYYENALGVTVVGATSATKVYRYVPAIGNGTAFTEYVLHDNNCLFANKTFRNNVMKFYKVIPHEYWIMFFTEYVELELLYNPDAGGWSSAGSYWCYEGWGVVNLNIHHLLAGLYTSVGLRMTGKHPTHTVISEDMTVYIDKSQIDERVVLEFNGLVGGKEYLAFEGIKDMGFNTIRNYYLGSKKNKKVLSLHGINRQKIETRFKDMANAEYLKSLLISEDVKILEASYAAPTPVTILTEDVKINKGIEFFTNQLDIEYEY